MAEENIFSGTPNESAQNQLIEENEQTIEKSNLAYCGLSETEYDEIINSDIPVSELITYIIAKQEGLEPPSYEDAYLNIEDANIGMFGLDGGYGISSFGLDDGYGVSSFGLDDGYGVSSFSLDEEASINSVEQNGEEQLLSGGFYMNGIQVYSQYETDISAESKVNYDKYVKDAEKVFDVTDYGAKPNDGRDDTGNIMRACYAANDYSGHSTIYLPSGEYNISANGGYEQAIELYSNTDFIMEPNTVLRLSGNNLGGYKEIMIHSSDNIRIIGGTVIGDRTVHTGTVGESGICIAIFDGYHIEVSDVNICNGWGDGIFIGCDSRVRTGCDDVVVKNCHIYNNRRNNVAICAADNVLIDNCLIENANGTAPQSGIDIEPESDQVAHRFLGVCNNITIRDTTINVVTPDAEHYALFSCWGWDQVSSDNVKILNCDINGIVLNGASTNCVVMDTKISPSFRIYQNTTICEDVKKVSPEIFVYNKGTLEVKDHSFVYSEKCDGHSLTLNDEIGVNYYMTISKEAATEPGAYVHMESENGAVKEIFLSEAKMTSRITAQMILPESGLRPQIAGEIHTYSVKEYGQQVIQNEDNYDPKLAALVKAMLNYGGYAQAYFNVNVNNLANLNLFGGQPLYTGAKDPVKSALPAMDVTSSGKMTNKEVTFYGSSLVCESKTFLKIYFMINANVDVNALVNNSQVYITLNGEERRIEKAIEDGMFVVYLYDVAPAELGKKFDYVIKTGTEEDKLSFQFSPMTYIVNSQTSSKQTLVNLTRAMYHYYQASDAYFNNR